MLIVELTGLVVGEDFVGFLDVFEAVVGGGSFGFGHLVWVVHSCCFVVGLFDFGFCRVACDF